MAPGDPSRHHEQMSGEQWITWRDLEAHRQQDAMHLYEMEQLLMRRMEPFERRIDSLEAVIDQQRGAKALVYVLIGSNLLAIIGFIVNSRTP